MILGVTGSRHGGGRVRVVRLFEFMDKHDVTELHHGDCKGWDYDAFLIAKGMGIRTVAHPCDISKWRANTDSSVILPVKPPLSRNRDIVEACDFIIAAPSGPEELRSGTWATVRYAKSVGRRGVVWPSQNKQ